MNRQIGQQIFTDRVSFPICYNGICDILTIGIQIFPNHKYDNQTILHQNSSGSQIIFLKFNNEDHIKHMKMTKYVLNFLNASLQVNKITIV